MTVKMCIKPFESHKFTESGGLCRSFHRQLENKHLHHLKNTSLKRTMPKKPQYIKRSVAQGNGSITQKVPDSIVRYGLRAANERTSSRKNEDFIYDVDKPSSVPEIQAKNVGDNIMFVCHDQNQVEEQEGGIVDTPPTLHVLESKYNASLKSVETCKRKGENTLNIEKTTTDEEEENNSNVLVNERSEKASAGTMAFVQILLHTLSCSFSCQQPSCRKMGMVLKHYHSCQEKRRKEAISRDTMRNSGGLKKDNLGNTPPKCGLCQQFAKIVAQHSMYLCNMSPNETGCPVPMCDMMRKIRDSRKNLESVPMQT